MKFKRGEWLMVNAGPYAGALVRYLRQTTPRGAAITVEVQNDIADLKKDMQIKIMPDEVIKSASRSVGKMQGSRQCLIMCIFCDYRLRGSDSSLRLIGIPKCPGCGTQMERMD